MPQIEENDDVNLSEEGPIPEHPLAQNSPSIENLDASPTGLVTIVNDGLENGRPPGIEMQVITEVELLIDNPDNNDGEDHDTQLQQAPNERLCHQGNRDGPATLLQIDTTGSVEEIPMANMSIREYLTTHKLQLSLVLAFIILALIVITLNIVTSSKPKPVTTPSYFLGNCMDNPEPAINNTFCTQYNTSTLSKCPLHGLQICTYEGLGMNGTCYKYVACSPPLIHLELVYCDSGLHEADVELLKNDQSSYNIRPC